MNFRADDPGAVQYGNFINYYQFHSAEDRIALLPENVWLNQSKETTSEAPYIVLDVGCNTGDFTRLLHSYLSILSKKEIQILGIDIDPTLIERAKENNKESQHIDFRCIDIMNDDDFSQIENYLLAHNVQKFNAVCCFSITMWIHLNHGDNGLKNFLKKCSNIAELLVIEPQPWKCYRTAVRRMQRSAKETFPNFSQLKWTTSIEDEIRKYLENDLKLRMIHGTQPTKWMRRICFYRQT